MYLLDIGIWLGAVWSDHRHHARVAQWFEAQHDDLIMCRVTQMGLLRLVSNPAIMGDQVVSRATAWQVVDKLRADERVRWMSEPSHLDHTWRAMSAQEDNRHKLWTDDYLAAFAQGAGVRIATLDRQFQTRYPSVSVSLV